MRQIERPTFLIIAAILAFGAVGGAIMVLVLRAGGA